MDIMGEIIEIYPWEHFSKYGYKSIFVPVNEIKQVDSESIEDSQKNIDSIHTLIYELADGRKLAEVYLGDENRKVRDSRVNAIRIRLVNYKKFGRIAGV